MRTKTLINHEDNKLFQSCNYFITRRKGGKICRNYEGSYD